MPTTNKEREIRIAQRRVEGFAQQFGEAHRNLARHAAFPLVLTPDLLYQIWANFVPEAPWTVVAHVLLSRLCRQVSYEMYEMDIADRNLLLRELKEEFGQERFDELGEFLLDYVAQRLNDDDADTRDLREAQEWTALAYTKPDEAARELAQRLSEMVQQEDMGEVLRLASLVDTLADPLVEAGFKPLVIYSKAMVAVSDGEQQDTVFQLRKLISVSDKQTNTILCYLYEKLEQDIFIEFVNENYYYFEDSELLLTAIYNNEYLDFESFVDLAIETLKPDFDGKVYVKYERYYSTHDEGERYLGSLGQQADQMHLSKVPEFITESHSDSLGVILENEQDIEMVLAILSTGEYELPESDIEGGTVEISIKKPELLEDSYEEYENPLDSRETIESLESTKTDALVELDKKLSDIVTQVRQSKPLINHINYRIHVLRLSSYVSGEDVIQYAILCLLQELHSGKDIKNPLAWAKVVCQRYINKQYNENKNTQAQESSQIEHLKNLQSQVNFENNTEQLHHIILQLKPSSRKIIEMRFFQELSWTQIAEVLSNQEGKEISVAVARKRVERAIQELRHFMTVTG
ncbi:sigma-70 family RNA polymerase sigma factor [Nostoc sp.]|uniref:sigma-70 family RNA polymerase sigma factor n=1 Tax=Nostoc sp. TaxID=1180 RepID=UPI002FF512E8